MFIRLKDTWWRVSFPPSSQPPSTHPQQPLWLFLSPLSSLRHRVTNTHIFLLLLFIFLSLKENKLLSGWGIVSLITVSLGAVFFRFLGVHGPSWVICECSVLIRLGKFSSVNFSNIFSLLPTPLLQRLQLHIYFPSHHLRKSALLPPSYYRWGHGGIWRVTDLPRAPQGGSGRLRPTPASGIPLAGPHPQQLQSITHLSASSSFRAGLWKRWSYTFL